ncbi:hypothetical protein Cus16_1291 [Curtobacterium sp. ER1/6]|nr:hypothetical protein Cus16_1291 [Curtobacterium sp. ER1/6]
MGLVEGDRRGPAGTLRGDVVRGDQRIGCGVQEQRRRALVLPLCDGERVRHPRQAAQPGCGGDAAGDDADGRREPCRGHGAAQGRPDVEQRCHPDDPVDGRARGRGRRGEGTGGPALQHDPLGAAGTGGVRGGGDAVDGDRVEGAQRQVGRVDHLVRGAERTPHPHAAEDLLRADRLPVHVDDVHAGDSVRLGAGDVLLAGPDQLRLCGREGGGVEEPASGSGPEGHAPGGGDRGPGEGGAEQLHGPTLPARGSRQRGDHERTGGAVPAGTAPPVRQSLLDVLGLDVTAPAGVGRGVLDALLVVVQVLLDGVAADAHGRAELLEEAGRLPVDLRGDAGLVVGQLVEGDHARVLDVAVLDGPRDALVRVLLGDDGAEVALLAGDLDGPVGRLVVDLDDLLDLVEEGGELLEPGPLVVGLADGDVDVDGLDDLGHARSFVRRAVRVRGER